MDDLQALFAQHFGRDDLAGATKWATEWYLRMGTPAEDTEGPASDFTTRAMAGHLSDYLEGFTGQEPESYNGGDKSYLNTQHGTILYCAMLDAQREIDNGQG